MVCVYLLFVNNTWYMYIRHLSTIHGTCTCIYVICQQYMVHVYLSSIIHGTYICYLSTKHGTCIFVICQQNIVHVYLSFINNTCTCVSVICQQYMVCVYLSFVNNTWYMYICYLSTIHGTCIYYHLSFCFVAWIAFSYCHLKVFES